ncbi:uncharacterized protein SPSK_03810 [Sporothrix schenckii 1099-18]|uniref:Uncharacterized protein n=1 Tax=Sporothrix schenckii 1099-18 TaxID=1397361 RepID=A0A0F2LYB4_SPOSC|nr:uncharacterized protein SPSK_03810 [Sporothrix schenckii 1099-18]KJR82442.1 hypothetical protein SPSK_03810 [Sporothrix schenckii 1099-18]
MFTSAIINSFISVDRFPWAALIHPSDVSLTIDKSTIGHFPCIDVSVDHQPPSDLHPKLFRLDPATAPASGISLRPLC